MPVPSRVPRLLRRCRGGIGRTSSSDGHDHDLVGFVGSSTRAELGAVGQAERQLHQWRRSVVGSAALIQPAADQPAALRIGVSANRSISSALPRRSGKPTARSARSVRSGPMIAAARDQDSSTCTPSAVPVSADRPYRDCAPITKPLSAVVRAPSPRPGRDHRKR